MSRLGVYNLRDYGFDDATANILQSYGSDKPSIRRSSRDPERFISYKSEDDNESEIGGGGVETVRDRGIGSSGIRAS